MALAFMQRPQFVVESHNPFLALWPHRFDFIQAPFPTSGEKPAWTTISSHKLADRLLLQGGALFGVRFHRETRYLMLDIDIGSRYHPQQDPFALGLLRAALEPLGLVSCITVTSSDSGGLHLYFPFQKPQSTYRLAEAAATLLQNQGFKIQTGQLEVFPNTKNYTTTGSPSLFNAHRLPLQEPASHLLNDNLEPIFSNPDIFVSLWKSCTQRNDIHHGKLTRILKSKKRKRYFVSTSAEKFLNDLNADIEPGWTDKGQSNFIFGRITMRTFIFHHVLAGGLPLSGKELIDECIATAKTLPGYKAFCRHQHDIMKRFTDWVRSIENSHYFPYGTKNGKYKAAKPTSSVQPTTPSWNERQSIQAQTKIKQAIAQLKEQGVLPEGATARFELLKKKFHCGGNTLYKHTHLWHPEHEHCEDPKTETLQSRVPARPEGANWHILQSLLSSHGGNTSSAEDFKPEAIPLMSEAGGNSLQPMPDQSLNPLEVEALRAARSLTQLQKASQQMARFLRSDDSILVDEALSQLQHNPLMLLEPSVTEAIQHAATVDEVSPRIALLHKLSQLRWSPDRITAELQARFEKTAIYTLTPSELLHWLEHLDSCHR